MIRHVSEPDWAGTVTSFPLFVMASRLTGGDRRDLDCCLTDTRRRRRRHCHSCGGLSGVPGSWTPDHNRCWWARRGYDRVPGQSV